VRPVFADPTDLAHLLAKNRFACYIPGTRRLLPMATVSISLPDEMKEWLDERLKNSRYATADDYPHSAGPRRTRSARRSAN
jgi:hypothetical protein